MPDETHVDPFELELRDDLKVFQEIVAEEIGRLPDVWQQRAAEVLSDCTEWMDAATDRIIQLHDRMKKLEKLLELGS